jgi:hypothetical protein
MLLQALPSASESSCIGDYLFVIKLKEAAPRQLARALAICEKLGAPITATAGPTTIASSLGIELNTGDTMARAHIREPA